MPKLTNITIWGMDNCARCRRAWTHIKEITGVEPLKADIRDIETGRRRDKVALQVFVALQMNDGKYPIVCVGERCFGYPEALAHLGKEG